MPLAFTTPLPTLLSPPLPISTACQTCAPTLPPSPFLSRRPLAKRRAIRPSATAPPRMMAQRESSPNPRDNAPTAKELAQLYGGSYLGTSILLSIVSYIALYFMIAAGVDVRALVNAFGDLLARTPVGRPSVLDNISDTASTATLAYIAHKATSPLRFPLTVAATPVMARAFSKKNSNPEGKSE